MEEDEEEEEEAGEEEGEFEESFCRVAWNRLHVVLISDAAS